MKYLIIIFVVYSLIGCNKESTNLNLSTFELKNNLGKLTIEIPKSMDTLYRWTKVGCTKCEDQAMLRFANKRYTLRTENGGLSFYKELPDSLCQLTIVQQLYKGCFKANDYVKLANNYINKLAVENPNYYPDVKIMLINNREYVVALNKTLENRKYNIEFSAMTYVDSNFVAIRYDYNGSKSNGFTNGMKENLLNSLKIK